MTDTLQPCTRCARHVRAGSRACPFCAAPIARGLARAALVAGVLLAPACGGGSSAEATPPSAGVTSGSEGSAPRPAAPPDASVADAGKPVPVAPPEPQPVPLYGGPPPVGSDRIV